MDDLSEVLKKLATRDTSADNPYLTEPGPNDDRDVCEVCGGRGWFTTDLPVGHPAFGRVVTCECQQQRAEHERRTRLLRYSNLASMSRFSFERLDPEGRGGDEETRSLFGEAYRAALEYAEAPSGWLVLSGPHGSGKTHLAAAIGNRRIENGHVVFFSHVPDLLDHLRTTFSPASEIAYSDLFEQVKSTPLLILDGLGSQSSTPWAEEKLRQLINHRYNTELPTVITHAGELERLDPYILSRLRTDGLSRVLELRAPSADIRRRLGQIEPQLLSRMTFESFDVRGNHPREQQLASLEGAYDAARNFAADPDGWLTLLGDTGVGKTHLAVAIAGEFLKRGGSVFFALVSDLLDYLRVAYGPDSTITYDRLLNEVRNTPLLILDDLGREHSTAWAAEKLYQIVVHRYNARAPTVITAVMNLAEEPGPIASRVRDPAIGQLVKIDAPDFRDKQRTPRARRRSTARTRGTGTG